MHPHLQRPPVPEPGRVFTLAFLGASPLFVSCYCFVAVMTLADGVALRSILLDWSLLLLALVPPLSIAVANAMYARSLPRRISGGPLIVFASISACVALLVFFVCRLLTIDMPYSAAMWLVNVIAGSTAGVLISLVFLKVLATRKPRE